LRDVWRRHEDELRAEADRRGITETWFEQRDEFVTLVRGEA
jgi:hypothetical protein